MNDENGMFNRFKGYFSLFFNKICEDRTYIIALLIVVSILYTLIFILIHGLCYTEQILTLNSDNSFIPDFIEMLWESYKGTPYDDGCTYFPLVFLFLKFLSFMVPILSEVDTYIMPITDPRMPELCLLYAVTVIICLGFAICTIIKSISGFHQKFIIIFLILFSSAMIWTIERGNIVYMGFPLLMYYCLNYDSESDNRRALSIISLVLAVSIKPYFCVFAVLLLRELQIKRIVVTTILIFIANIVAIQFFGGLESISLLISNMIELNGSQFVFEGFKMDIINTINIVGKIINPDFFFDSMLFRIMLVMALIIESILVKNRCIGLTAAILSYIMFTNISWVYLLIFLIIPITMFMRNHEQDSTDYFFILLSLLLLVFPINIFIPVGVEHVSYIYLINAICYAIISLSLGADGIRRVITKCHGLWLEKQHDSQ